MKNEAAIAGGLDVPLWWNWHTQPPCTRPTPGGVIPVRIRAGANRIYDRSGAVSDKEPKKRGPKPDRLVIEGDPGAALDRLIGRKLVDAKTFKKTCPTCGAEMEQKFYMDPKTGVSTPEVWVCPNREDGKHPDPDHAEPTGR